MKYNAYDRKLIKFYGTDGFNTLRESVENVSRSNDHADFLKLIAAKNKTLKGSDFLTRDEGVLPRVHDYCIEKLKQLRHPPASVSTILDVGCEAGLLTKKLCQAFPSAFVVGLDVVPECIERARERRLRNAQFVCADISTWKSPSVYDIAMCVCPCIYEQPNTYRLEVYANIYQALKPGGRLLFVERVCSNDHLLSNAGFRMADDDEVRLFIKPK